MFSSNQKVYVVDTNILIDCPTLIPAVGQDEQKPEDATVDLSGAHIVIPTAVIRELSNFKNERSERGKMARIVLRRLRELLEGRIPPTMAASYNLKPEAQIICGDQTFSILPVHSDFKKSLPFRPSDDDMDGQIILAALAVAFIRNGRAVDGSYASSMTPPHGPSLLEISTDGVVLLTNDNELAERAFVRGLECSRYGYRYPEPYTGRREVVVPPEIFYEFYDKRELEREVFEVFLPEQPRLVANEFIVMRLEDPEDYPAGFSPETTPYFKHVGRYDVEEDKIVSLKYATRFPVPPHNVGQAIYAEALMDDRFAAVICTGPAGAGKTYMPTIYGYSACMDGTYLGITVVPCETHGKLGALPGGMDSKLDPNVRPLKNALRNYLLENHPHFKKELEKQHKTGVRWRFDDLIKKLKGDKNEDDAPESLRTKLERYIDLCWTEFFTNIPIEHARGRDFAHEIVIYDEFQDQNATQADTLIKRLGRGSKIIITGDVNQIHSPYLDANNNGLVYASSQLYDHPAVAQVCFTEDEVVRHPLVMEVAKRQKEAQRRRREGSEA